MPVKKPALTPLNVLKGVALALGISGAIYALVNIGKPPPPPDVSSVGGFSEDEIAKSPPSNITEQEALRRANMLYTAMRGFGTNEMTIYKALMTVNKAGLMLIFNQFGSRRGQNLYQWFMDDLGYKELAVVSEIWKKQGINVPF